MHTKVNELCLEVIKKMSINDYSNTLNLGEQLWDFQDVRALLDEFLELYNERPILDNFGGMSSTHLFWTWYILRKLSPKNIIESGVFKGQGTWLMAKVCPEANIFSIDPNLAQRVYINNNVKYFSEDFSFINWNDILEPEDTICFFDDHQDAYLRLQQMKWMGFKKAIFEDNYPESQGDCYSCKKILTGCGLKINGQEKIVANMTHAQYFVENVKRYTTLPPLFKNEFTRWGDEWNDENYPTPPAILSDKDVEQYKIVKDEGGGYTWICYLELV